MPTLILMRQDRLPLPLAVGFDVVRDTLHPAFVLGATFGRLGGTVVVTRGSRFTRFGSDLDPVRSHQITNPNRASRSSSDVAFEP